MYGTWPNWKKELPPGCTLPNWCPADRVCCVLSSRGRDRYKHLEKVHWDDLLLPDKLELAIWCWRALTNLSEPNGEFKRSIACWEKLVQQIQEEIDPKVVKRL
jgi:hypothetical protein